MDKIITKTSKTAIEEKKREEQQDKTNASCPECGHYEPFNKKFIRNRTEDWGVIVKETQPYKCKERSCEWDIVFEDALLTFALDYFNITRDDLIKLYKERK